MLRRNQIFSYDIHVGKIRHELRRGSRATDGIKTSNFFITNYNYPSTDLFPTTLNFVLRTFRLQVCLKGSHICCGPPPRGDMP